MELLQQTVKENLLAKQKVGITQKHLGALISDLSTKKKGTQISQKGNSKYVKRELFCVKTACEGVSKFGNELLQNFNDIKICSCNDTLDK